VIGTWLPPRVIGKVSPSHLGYDGVWGTAQGMTTKAVKFGSSCGQLLESLINNEHYEDQRKLAMDLSTALNDEYHGPG
jgi:hypothetical protein